MGTRARWMGQTAARDMRWRFSCVTVFNDTGTFLTKYHTTFRNRATRWTRFLARTAVSNASHLATRPAASSSSTYIPRIPPRPRRPYSLLHRSSTHSCRHQPYHILQPVSPVPLIITIRRSLPCSTCLKRCRDVVSRVTMILSPPTHSHTYTRRNTINDDYTHRNCLDSTPYTVQCQYLLPLPWLFKLSSFGSQDLTPRPSTTIPPARAICVIYNRRTQL